MGDIRDSANETWRDYVTSGVSSSGAHEPLKADIRTTMGVVEDLVAKVQAGNGMGLLTYTTLSSMNADTTQADHVTAQNLEDDNIYRWNDGGGAWVLVGPNAGTRLTRLEEGVYPAADVLFDTLKRTTVDRLAGSNINKAYNESGAMVTSSGRYATDLIRVSPTTRITRFGTGVMSGSPSFPPYSFFDEDRAALGFAYDASTDNIQTCDIADAPAGTAYLGLMGNSTISAYLYEPTQLDLLKDLMFSLFGTPIDMAGQLTEQYFNKSTGAIANSSSWRLSSPIRVDENSYVAVTGGLVSDTQTSQAQIGFYSSEILQDATTFLGYYNSKAPNETVKIGDHYDTALSILVAMPSTDVAEVYVVRPNPEYDRSIDMVSTAAIVDWFSAALVEPGRIDSDGSITQPTHEYWRNTDFIPVVEGQVFYLTCTDATGTGPTVAGYDASKAYTGAVLQLSTNNDRTNYRVVIPADVAFIRGMYRNDTTPNAFLGARTAQSLAESSAAETLKYLAPDTAYGRVDEPIYAYAAGVVAERTVPVAWGPQTPGDFASFVGSYKVRMVLDAEGEAAVDVRAFPITGRIELGEMTVRATDTAGLVSPVTALNIIAIGDSTTSQLSGDANSTDGNGTWINEVLRQLTGTGDPALVVAADGVNSLNTGSEWGAVVSGDIRAALALSNIYGRGTRGGGAVKHEGRGGWHPSNYLERTNGYSLKISASFVSGNSISGEMTDGTTVRTVGPISYATSSDATLTALAAAIQTAMRLYGTGVNPPTAVVKDSDEITLSPKWNLTFQNWAVTGGASQPSITFLGDGKFNPFWDPDMTPWGPASEYQFSMLHYVETYGFDDGTIGTGVDSTGSNLLVIIALGQNDYGDGTEAGTSAGHMAHLIDQIHRDYPDATVLVPSLWAPPDRSFKGNTGSLQRFYSPADIFEDSTRAYGDAYRTVCQDTDRTLSGTVDAEKTVFLQVSHQIDPDFAFSKTSLAPNRVATDSTLAMTGAGDHVHKRRRGYRMFADVIADYILWHYCRS